MIAPVDSIDRLAPTRRPPGRAAFHQRWAELLFLHWELPPAVLTALLPAGLTLDTFEGRAYVGVVPFTMTGIRPWWAPPLPWLSAFHEVNVRTYVHHGGRDPGVWFLSLDAANGLGVWVARTLFHLPYHHARMSLRHQGDSVVYHSARRRGGAGCAFRYAITGAPAAAAPGTLEHFLAERYLLYAVRRGRLLRGRVHHAPYTAFSVFITQRASVCDECHEELGTKAIAEHACLKYSGRVGRSAAAKRLDEEAVRLAAWAHVRHKETGYDRMLNEGLDQSAARAAVRPEVEAVLARWTG